MSASKIFYVLYWVWIVSEVLLVLLTWTRRSRGSVQDRGSMLVLWVVIFASVDVGMSLRGLEGLQIFGGVHWVKIAAVTVLVAGLAIRWTAILTLGRSFSVNVAILATQTVQKTGMFGVARHPSYSGLMLVFVALGLRTGNWLGLAILVIPTGAALLYRIRVEEQALRKAFGEEYVEYSRETKRLIPGVY